METIRLRKDLTVWERWSHRCSVTPHPCFIHNAGNSLLLQVKLWWKRILVGLWHQRKEGVCGIVYISQRKEFLEHEVSSSVILHCSFSDRISPRSWSSLVVWTGWPVSSQYPPASASKQCGHRCCAFLFPCALGIRAQVLRLADGAICPAPKIRVLQSRL